MVLGTIERLWRYPVKSLAPESLSQVCVETGGLAGDRTAALLVDTSHNPRSGKPYRGKEHARLHTVATTAEAQRLGAAAGVGLRVVSGGRYFDAQPVSLLFDTWLADVEALVGSSLDALRFRPNMFVRAAASCKEREAACVGWTIEVGSVVLRVVSTIGRCVTTTYDVTSGVAEPSVLREVARRRSNIVGVYCAVLEPGTATLGDSLVRPTSGD